ncbi:hypothetical protein VFPPC_16624 [Pochonia chlamydosporia 170]|uniref:Uncharacterized protein n=1 Tax=Pochonia chlamydosporia 170 TaxID=1380566 RepID=A0A179F9S3_METCM|nr:hypothetical protein VFPPC_16624 [Pochonia chlamydosporia 170]OAQ62206.1 hypothetical protein VFPPC_16624 [Pochonia chlamydosporia 170]
MSLLPRRVLAKRCVQEPDATKGAQYTYPVYHEPTLHHPSPSSECSQASFSPTACCPSIARDKLERHFHVLGTFYSADPTQH